MASVGGARFMLRDPAHWVAFGFGSGLLGFALGLGVAFGGGTAGALGKLHLLIGELLLKSGLLHQQAPSLV
jgi:hypothetical protein